MRVFIYIYMFIHAMFIELYSCVSRLIEANTVVPMYIHMFVYTSMNIHTLALAFVSVELLRVDTHEC